MKTLEENRYKRTYNADCRRVSWLVNNNLSEDYESMPISMRKKWSKAQYGRERYLAKEFLKAQKQKMSESKLREAIREIIKEQLNEGKLTEATLTVSYTPIFDADKKSNLEKLAKKSGLNIRNAGPKAFKVDGKKKNVEKFLKLTKGLMEQLNEVSFAELYMKNDMKTKLKVSKIIKQMKLKIDKDYDVKALDSKGKVQKFLILPKHRNKFLELLLKNKIKVRG